MASTLLPVILCGGSGSRLWPLSRSEYPKQFIKFDSAQSLFQQAVLRGKSAHAAAPLVITNESQRFLVAEQLRELGCQAGKIILEPEGRNTAPALTLSALVAKENGEDPILLVTPSDHLIENSSAFLTALEQAIPLAEKGEIIIFGIPPTHPETAYGYIKTPNTAAHSSEKQEQNEQGLHVQFFAEKPNEETAQKYLSEGGYFWNAGIFVLKASVWLNAIQLFRPDIYQATLTALNAGEREQLGHLIFIRPSASLFSQVPSESIDYAVMENCVNAELPLKMLRLEAGWNDLGAWDAVWQALNKDDMENAYHGDILTYRAKQNIIYSGHRLVTLVGVNNLVVVETEDAVLVADRKYSQDVKHLVATMNSQQRVETREHRKIYRPWGWYDNVDSGLGFKVRRIFLNPGASLHLQRHEHRAEHWIVVKGKAEVTHADSVFILEQNQSTYIPPNTLHRLHNPTESALEIIEIQTGSSLTEEDTIRFTENIKDE